jgi:glucose/arabinose dehydrogenase/PKD repeat protein
MVITSQSGRLYKRSGGGTTLVLNISGKICANFERGLLGVAVDPNFSSNSYIYLYYTYNKHGSCAYNSASSPVNRVSRFTFRGTTVANETVLVDNIPSPGGNHNAGGLQFGNDGYLYIAVGDGGCQIGAPTNCGGSNANSRSKHRLLGKILRVDRNGNAPSSNPFYDTGGVCRTTAITTSGQHCRETYAWGFRNPFRIASDPNSSSTRIFANDVGQNLWEEIDHVTAGNDYGWNHCEGFHANGSGAQCGFADRNPIFEYGHGNCNSISAGAFIPNGIWPSTYDGRYFFSDYTCGTIWTLSQSGGSWTRSVFATGLGAVTEMEFGPHNSAIALYYTNYGNGQIRRISNNEASSNEDPVADIKASPTFGELPLTVSFDGRGSEDPDGDSLTYKWDFGDGTSSTRSRFDKTYTQKREYRVTLTVSDGRGGSDTDSVTIDAGNTRPTAEITSPSSSMEYFVGQTITLTGVGTDAEDDPSTIPPNRMTWQVLLHHDVHTHPLFGPTTGNNLTFQAPPPEDLMAATNSYLEIILTVRDSDGLGKIAKMNLFPNKVDVTVDSNVPGMLVWIEGQPFTTPATVVSWENNPLRIEAPDQVGQDGQPYVYRRWSDAGRRVHDYDTPADDSTVTAEFNVLAGDTFAAHADARVAEAYPDRNEGGGTGLSAKSGTGSDYETIIRFKVEGIGEDVSKAMLYLYAYDGTVNGPVIYETTPSWRESGVTWNTKPGATSGVVDNYGAIAKRSWIAYDVTDAIDGNGYVSFVIRGQSSDAVSWYSRQAASNQPRLVIVSSGPLAAEEPDPFASPTASVTPEATATATSTPEPDATETPTAEVPTATTTPDPGTPEASPVPYSDDFEAGSDGWSAEGAVIAAGEGTAGSTGVVLASSGTDQVAGAPSYIQRPLGDNVTTIYASADVRIDAIDANGARLLTAVDETGAAVASLYALADGTIAIRWADAAEVAVVAQLPVGGWQRIEAAVTVGSGTVSVSIWLDGAGVWSGSAPATATSISTVIFGGWTTDRSYRIAVDNVALDVTCTGQCGEIVPTATPAPTEPVNTEEPGTPPAG